MILDLNVGRVSIMRRPGERKFQGWEADWLKTLLPMMTTQARGTENWRDEEEWSTVLDCSAVVDVILSVC